MGLEDIRLGARHRVWIGDINLDAFETVNSAGDAVASFVAVARQTLGDDMSDPRAGELIGELSIANGRFRTIWARHDVRTLEGGSATVNHPMVGKLSLHREKLPVGDVILVVYYPDETASPPRNSACSPR